MASSASPAVLGLSSNFWLFSNHDGFDLTRPLSPPRPPERRRVKLETPSCPITISIDRTALVIIDMQNFFLSSAMGRSRGPGHNAEDALLQYAIPAARQAEIQIVWITWGISQEELKSVPPAVFRAFGFEMAHKGDFEVANDHLHAVSEAGRNSGSLPADEPKTLRCKERKRESGLGLPLGNVRLDNGTTVDAGRMLMRGQWNTRLHDPLQKAFDEGQHVSLPDTRFHKTRASGMWGAPGDLEAFLEDQGITTLLFAGVNTDQCVLATLQDANSKGYDTVLLTDGCGTSSPSFAKEMVEFNCQKGWGFVSSCESLAKGVEDFFAEHGSQSRNDQDRAGEEMHIE